MSLPTRALGATGRTVTRIGLGGEGVLRTRGREAEAAAVLAAAYGAGLTYYDCARAYDESERYHGLFWPTHDRSDRFIASKSAERRGKGARAQLDETLGRMALDHLDLWQIHDVRTDAELDEVSAPGGALEAFLEAKKAGKVRHVGVTGHHHPAILARAVSEWPVDTVLLPVNPMEGVLGGFLTQVVPAARAKGLGIIGMKALGGAGGWGGAGGGRLTQAGFAPEPLLAYALGQDVDVLIVGCASPAEVAKLVAAALAGPLGAEEQAALLAAMRPRAGQMASYRGDFTSPC